MLGHEGQLQLGRKIAGGLVASDHRIIGCGNHAAQIAQVELVEIGLGRVGPVEPLGDSQLREQLLGHRQHPCGRDLVVPLCFEARVLLVDRLADRRDAALQGAFCNRALCLG